MSTVTCFNKVAWGSKKNSYNDFFKNRNFKINGGNVSVFNKRVSYFEMCALGRALLAFASKFYWNLVRNVPSARQF